MNVTSEQTELTYYIAVEELGPVGFFIFVKLIFTALFTLRVMVCSREEFKQHLICPILA